MNPHQPPYNEQKGSSHPAQMPPAYPQQGPYAVPPIGGGDSKVNQRGQYPPQAMGAPPPNYTAGPNPSPDGRRILHVYHEGWTHRHTQVLDSDKTTPLYTINANSGGCFSSKPHMTILNATTGAVAGTVSFHQMSSDIDVEVHGKPIPFTKPGMFSSSHEFQSLANGTTFKWKRDGVFSGGDLKCIDGREQIVATFELSNWAIKKDGKFEIAPLVNGPFFDEVMVTGIAAMEYERKERNSSSGGGG